jgi:hypothetical protein
MPDGLIPPAGRNRKAFYLGTKLTTIISVGMGEPDLRSLERSCRAQAALTTHEPTKHALEKMAEEYRRQADFQDSQQDNEQ